ncbi:CRE-GLT-7 protein [Caenorhabditis remanei]|uniref:Amino acid transporter n=1 Tax=Caenorhabditis remanei TaxID=31234 RepID=E3M6V2_CAERE|nr:CRE-GLT-7 protein [Caenorhabditis remanei]
MKENQLLVFTLSAVGTGFCVGIFLRQFDLSDGVRNLVGFPGEIFMQVLKLMVLPLIFSSLISSLGQMDASKSGKMSLIAVSYYLTTVIIACFIAMIIAFLFHPGNPELKKQNDTIVRDESHLSALDSLLDLVRNMFPQNIVEATMYRSQTAFVVVRKKIIKNGTTAEPVLLRKTIKLTQGTNILGETSLIKQLLIASSGLIVFCTGFGIIISKLGGKVKVIVEFFIVLDKVVMKFISVLMWFSPVGIISLIAASILDIDDVYVMITTMLLYLFTVMTCLFLHCVVAIPVLYFFITKKNPIHVAKGMIQPFVTAIGTASSGASLPQAISSVEENLHIDSRIAGFIMPLGNTINMDGNALYEAVAVIFIAQINNIHLSFAQVITICVTATFASIGLNAVPAGLVSMFVILSTVNLPVSDISLLFTVDWFIDRVRTALNVLGDAYCACVVQHFMESDLAREKNEKLWEDLKLEEGTSEDANRPDQLEGKRMVKRVSFVDYHHIPSPSAPQAFNSTKTYSLKSAIIGPLRAHVALQTRLSHLSEE